MREAEDSVDKPAQSAPSALSSSGTLTGASSTSSTELTGSQPAVPPKDASGVDPGRLLRRLVNFQERGVLLALIIIGIAAALISPTFLHTDNLTGILQDITFLGMLTVGVAMAMIAGEIDISVGSVFGLTSVIAGLMFQGGHGVVESAGIGLLAGLGCGLANGVTSWLLRIPAIIVTLATLGIYRAMALALASGGEVDFSPNNKFFFGTFGNGTVLGGVSYLTLLYFAIAVVVGFVLARTMFGFRLYSVGSNPIAARLVGIHVTRTKVIVLMLSGLFAGIAGVASVAYLGSANPTAGNGYELDALAAAIIGGVALTGGRGSILGIFLGLLIVGIVRDILVLAGVSTDWATGVSGGVLLVAVGLNRAFGQDQDGDQLGLVRRARMMFRARTYGGTRRGD